MDAWNRQLPERSTVFEVFAEAVKAIANGRRLELMELMAQGEHSVEELARLTGMAMTTTSAHLQTLNRAGLVSKRRERTTINYKLSGDDVAQLYTAAKRVALSRYPRLRDALDDYMGRPDGGVPVIAPAEVTSSMYIIDVRPLDEYQEGHFPGAVSVPLDQLIDRIDEIPKDKEIAVYCRGELCRLATEAAALLRDYEIEAMAMAEGIVEWRADKKVDLGIA
ncbi:Rhodanese-related sulfurtransferase [Brevibacterium siliguriense]|uniref:Rhodanese-related sulfurtransferase n=1 Tax=Brevibacterium siliguriense TaxID=1136497 RepID=A0A1H1QAY2_9MICO|nr:metalloregulator ArsR/SmtB family transcription factor [Brevibacterium siliguriense]SDS20039.1 Rhodanese-related sulfurtransferase [Brevibacterium siliguriense]